MRLFNLIFVVLFLISFSFGQQFQWANSYNVNNCNEVAAIATDVNGNIIITGVHDASVSLPYTGNAYIQKCNPEGSPVWTEYLTGTIQIGDMATIDSSMLIIGHSVGQFTFLEQQYGTDEVFMFTMKVDANGLPEWFIIDETKYGANTNISVGENGNIALHIRGQYNLGDWIIIIDADGNTLNSKLLSATTTLVKDLAFYNNKVYINGGFNGIGSIVIDTVVIPSFSIEHTAFVLALNEDLIAEWAVGDTTINNRDGIIEANEKGIFTYQEVLEPPFTVVNSMKKYNFTGQLIKEVVVPVFSSAISLYPDMVVTPTRLAFFVQNAFNFDSHEVILFDSDLNLISEKFINGPSDLYSGQITAYGEDIILAHVHSGGLNFNDEIDLAYTGSGKKPYISKLSEPQFTSIKDHNNKSPKLIIYPNPANELISIRFNDLYYNKADFNIFNPTGNVVLSGIIQNSKPVIDVSQLIPGFYFVKLEVDNYQVFVCKIFKD